MRENLVNCCLLGRAYLPGPAHRRNLICHSSIGVIHKQILHTRITLLHRVVKGLNHLKSNPKTIMIWPG
jgi:hypothetical protein